MWQELAGTEGALCDSNFQKLKADVEALTKKFAASVVSAERPLNHAPTSRGILRAFFSDHLMLLQVNSDNGGTMAIHCTSQHITVSESRAELRPTQTPVV